MNSALTELISLRVELEKISHQIDMLMPDAIAEALSISESLPKNRIVLSNPSGRLVKFDTQKMVNPEVNGVEYQRGELWGYEVRQYLLEKFNHTCVYCGATNKPFNLDHFHPKSKGGSDRVSNLVLSCVECNQAKGDKLPAEFLSDRLDILAKIEKQRKQPLADAAAVNATRWKLKEVLESTSLPVELGSGGLTKYNRQRLNITKSHWTDAACVGQSTPNSLNITGYQPLIIKAMGRGSRQMVKPDKYGFPRTSPKLRQKSFYGFMTGDIVKAVVTKGKKLGTYVGRVAVRKTGNFNVKTKTDTVQGISHKYCRHLHKSDGYTYNFGQVLSQKVNQPKPSQIKPKQIHQFKGIQGDQLSLF
ncbi:MAG: RNA-guided endonuclease IscB [Phormidium sp.]